MWKVLTIIFFIISLPIILLVIFASLALFGKAPTCPLSTQQVNANTPQIKMQTLQKTGSVTFSSAEITSGLQSSFQDKVKDFRVCFTDGKINASGIFMAGNFSPTFYLSTQVNDGDKLQLEGTDVSIGWLGKIPGFSKLFGSIAEGALNDQLRQISAHDPTNYTIKIEGDNIEIKMNKSTKKN